MSAPKQSATAQASNARHVIEPLRRLIWSSFVTLILWSAATFKSEKTSEPFLSKSYRRNLVYLYQFGSSLISSVARLGNFLKPLATINLPKSPTYLGNFCKGVKIDHFSSGSFLCNFYRHLGIFSGHAVETINKISAKKSVSIRLKWLWEMTHDQEGRVRIPVPDTGWTFFTFICKNLLFV